MKRFVMALALLCGCAANSQYMVEQPRQALVAPPDSAVIVFVRPSSLGFAIKTTILDEQGHFLGDSMAKSHFAVTVPPGRHMFIAWAENTGVLVADVAAGKVYFVEVAPRMGWWSARMHLFAISPRSESWAERESWMTETREFASDRNAGQLYLNGRWDEVSRRIADAQKNAAEFQGEDLARRTLMQGDGL
jgi:hypothetical protein